MQHSLIQAVLEENVIEVAKLLEQGADPNVFEDADKLRPLHFIAQKNSTAALQIARLLLNAGADPLAETDPDGLTPLDVAVMMQTGEEMVQVLSDVENETLH